MSGYTCHRLYHASTPNVNSGDADKFRNSLTKHYIALFLLLLFPFRSKTGSSCKVLSAEIPLYSFVKHVSRGNGHVCTSGTIFVGGELTITFENEFCSSPGREVKFESDSTDWP